MERDGKLTTGGYIIVLRKSMARNENSANNVRFSYSVLTIEVPNVKSQIWDLYCKHCLLHICFNVVDIFTRNAFLAALYLLIIL